MLSNFTQNIFKLTGGVLLLFSLVFSPSSIFAASTRVQKDIDAGEARRIFYYRPTTKALYFLAMYPESIDVLAPQTYGVNSEGELSGDIDPRVIAAADKYQIKLMPLVVNTNFHQGALHDLLDSPRKQKKVIRALITEGKKRGYWGWQFDFEQMTSDERDRYSDFVARAYRQFQKADLILSVAVIAQHSDHPDDYPDNLWQRVIGAYDYAKIAAHSDFVSIMAYDQPKSGGPVASLPWTEKVIAYTLTKMPAEKISLGVPFYFWKWDEARGKIVDIGSYNRIAALLQERKDYQRLGFSEKHGTPWVEYYRAGRLYTAWYENGQSFKRRLDLIDKYNLSGFSAWALGLEDPAVHTVLKGW